MKSEKILILYRDGNYKWKKLKKLTKDDMNKKEIKYTKIRYHEKVKDIEKRKKEMLAALDPQSPDYEKSTTEIFETL